MKEEGRHHRSIFILLLFVSLLILLPAIIAKPTVDRELKERVQATPHESFDVVLALTTPNAETIREHLRKKTFRLDREIASTREHLREQFTQVKDSLEYASKETTLKELYYANDPQFMATLHTVLEKHALRGKKHKTTLAHLETLQTERNKIVTNFLRKKYKREQRSVVIMLDEMEDVVYEQDILTNRIFIQDISLQNLIIIARNRHIKHIYLDHGTAIQESDVSVPTTGVQTFHNAGYDGATADLLFLNLDGILVNHTFLDHITWKNKCFWFGCSSTNPTNNHDTLVASIIGSDDGFYHGVAPNIERFYNGRIKDFISSKQAVSWALNGFGDDADLITMSLAYNLGSSADCGDDVYAKYFDGVIDTLDVNTFKSAGNQGFAAWKGVTQPGAGYNIVAVGASYDKNTVDRTDDVIYDSSSYGPTGICNSFETRIKPDIVAPGRVIEGAGIYNQPSGTTTGSGTSFASPHAAGSAVLLQQYGGLSARGVRALMINSAEDRDEITHAPGVDGPDTRWGYGYLDMTEAFFDADNVRDIILTENVPVYYQSQGIAYDTVTAVWNRHLLNDVGLVNDVNVYLFEEATNTYIDQSEYVGRNIEQVMYDNSYDASVIKVVMPTVLTGSVEDVALAANDNLNLVSGPSLTVEAFSFIENKPVPKVFPCTSNLPLTMRVTNTGDLPAHNINIDLTLPDSFTITDEYVTIIPYLASGASTTVQFIVSAVSEGDGVGTVSAVSQSYGEILTDQTSFPATSLCNNNPRGLTNETNQSACTFNPVTGTTLCL